MHIDHFTIQIETFSKEKVWLLCEREAPAKAAELRAFECSHGYTLPPEYALVATTWGFGEFGYTEILSIRQGVWSIDDRRKDAPGLPANFVPISENGCGDFYGFEIKNGKCQSHIVFADHESYYQLTSTQFDDLYEYLNRFGFNKA